MDPQIALYIQLASQVGTWAVFLTWCVVLFRRNQDIGDARIQELKDAQAGRLQELKDMSDARAADIKAASELLAKTLASQSIIDIKNALLDQTNSKRDT